MKDSMTRRDFLKLAGIGAGVATILTGCGTSARYVQRQPYTSMPEYSLTGKDTYFATTCGACSAGCGIVVRTQEGRALKVEGNPMHPISLGKSCSRAQASLQGLYNPDRVQGPGRQEARGTGRYTPIEWEAAIGAVKDALANHAPGELAFLLGIFPDHLSDLVQMMASGLGGANVLRFGLLGEFEARGALVEAAQNLFGTPRIPYFDFQRAEVTFSFGANFSETWLSPVAYSRAYGIMRQGHPGQRGYLVHFEPRMSQTAASADEWIPIRPGSETLLARALGRIVGGIKRGNTPQAFLTANISEAAEASGIPEAEIRRLARIFAGAPRAVALPGGLPLGQVDGLAAAEAILALNILVGNLGQEGGLFFTPETPLYPHLAQPSGTLADAAALVGKMNAGQIKVLFVHGPNPVYELPQALGFAAAMEKVPLVISFASFLDETAMQADYLLPDHTPLESWGYQRSLTGGDRPVVSGLQPVVAPLHNTRSTADVLLAAAHAVGGSLASVTPFQDEVDFLQQSVSVLEGQGGVYTARGLINFWPLWQQYGGWWPASPGLETPKAQVSFNQPFSLEAAPAQNNLNSDEAILLPFPHPNLGDGSGANLPWLQEAPDPMTTVMWNSWVEMHPETAQQFGFHSDDVVKISSEAGSIEAVVYVYPAIRPGVVAIPLGQGHTALGRYARDRGANPMKLLELKLNEAGGLAFGATRVRLSHTGQRRPLARYESRVGVYGEKGEPSV